MFGTPSTTSHSLIFVISYDGTLPATSAFAYTQSTIAYLDIEAMSSSPAPFPTPSGLLEYELPDANLMRDLRRIFDEALANHPVNLNSSVRTDNLVQEILSLEILYLHATNDYHESRARWFRYRDFSDILIEKARKTTYPNSRILVDALERLKESDEEMLSSLFGRMLDAWIGKFIKIPEGMFRDFADISLYILPYAITAPRARKICLTSSTSIVS
jgi:hypothetical protein